MANIKIIAEFFLLSIAWTLTLFSPIASSKLTGNGLIKLLSNVSIGALVITLVISFASGESILSLPLYLKLMALVALVATSLFHEDHKTFLMWAMYTAVVISLGVHIVLFSPIFLSALFLASSTLLLGVITYAMILGHWYLVVPKLSEHPLKRAALITWIILGLKLFSV